MYNFCFSLFFCLFFQCQIASNLKYKLAKCIRDHVNVLRGEDQHGSILVSKKKKKNIGNNSNNHRRLITSSSSKSNKSDLLIKKKSCYSHTRVITREQHRYHSPSCRQTIVHNHYHLSRVYSAASATPTSTTATTNPVNASISSNKESVTSPSLSSSAIQAADKDTSLLCNHHHYTTTTTTNSISPVVNANSNNEFVEQSKSTIQFLKIHIFLH